MDDFISREAAIRFFNKWADDLDKQIDDSVAYPHLRSDYKVCKTQLLDCIHAIEEMPAADVRPVVRGKWEKHEDFDPYGGGRFVEWVCSECDKRLRGDWATRNHIEETPTENFCPNCGADMRRSEDGV